MHYQQPAAPRHALPLAVTPRHDTPRCSARCLLPGAAWSAARLNASNTHESRSLVWAIAGSPRHAPLKLPGATPRHATVHRRRLGAGKYLSHDWAGRVACQPGDMLWHSGVAGTTIFRKHRWSLANRSVDARMVVVKRDPSGRLYARGRSTRELGPAEDRL